MVVPIILLIRLTLQMSCWSNSQQEFGWLLDLCVAYSMPPILSPTTSNKHTHKMQRKS